jgi:hypothetical protein
MIQATDDTITDDTDDDTDDTDDTWYRLMIQVLHDT